MWIVDLTFTETPERIAARPAHRGLLADLHAAGVVRMAGPYADDTGAMIVFDTSDRRALDNLIAGDPYFTTPGVRVERIREWQPFLV